MSLWKIAWRSIQQRALSSSLTALSMALGVALVVAVLVMHAVVSDSFDKGARGYNIIIGAKDNSSLDLVLTTVYHLGKSKANLPWSYYKQFLPGGKYASSVASAIPVCLGDNYEGYRVVGTVPKMFDLEYAPGEKYKFAAGRNFEHEHFYEAVIGSVVAQRTGLRVGDEFEPTHGVSDDGQGHKHDGFEIVGILAPTGTPNDRALFINMEGFFLLEGHAKEGQAAPAAKHDHDHADHKHEADHKHAEEKPAATKPATVKEAEEKHEEKSAGKTEGPAAPSQKNEKDEHKHEADHKHEEGHKHDDKHEHAHDHAHGHAHHHEHHEPLPEDQREVTAILVSTPRGNALAPIMLQKSIAREPFGHAVFPAKEVYDLVNGVVGPMRWLLLVLAGLIVIVAGIGVMVSIYNSMSDRRREIAVMRSLGARRSTVLAVVLLESILLSLGGGALGVVIGHGLLSALSPWAVAYTGVSLGAWQFVWYELVLIPVLILLASAVGYLPALSAYRTDVAKALVSG